MSRNYEMMFVLRPDLSDEQTDAAIAKYKDQLTELGGTNIQMDVWGRRRLAYPIKKFNDGVYVLLHYQADGQQIAPLERAMRLSEDVLRFLTLKIDALPNTGEEAEAVAAETEATPVEA